MHYDFEFEKCERCGAQATTELASGEFVCDECCEALSDYDLDVIEAQINAMMGPQCGQVD